MESPYWDEAPNEYYLENGMIHHSLLDVPLTLCEVVDILNKMQDEIQSNKQIKQIATGDFDDFNT